jgi:hypothetical protein
MGYFIYRHLVKPSSKPTDEMRALRLLLSDVEHSLMDVYYREQDVLIEDTPKDINDALSEDFETNFNRVEDNKVKPHEAKDDPDKAEFKIADIKTLSSDAWTIEPSHDSTLNQSTASLDSFQLATRGRSNTAESEKTSGTLTSRTLPTRGRSITSDSDISRRDFTRSRVNSNNSSYINIFDDLNITGSRNGALDNLQYVFTQGNPYLAHDFVPMNEMIPEETDEDNSTSRSDDPAFIKLQKPSPNEIIIDTQSTHDRLSSTHVISRVQSYYKNNQIYYQFRTSSIASERIVARGILLFNLCRLRDAVDQLFMKRSNYMIHLTFLNYFFDRKSLILYSMDYLNISCDLIDLMAPDFEINGERKLRIVNKMRSVHECFSNNRWNNFS